MSESLINSHKLTEMAGLLLAGIERYEASTGERLNPPPPDTPIDGTVTIQEIVGACKTFANATKSFLEEEEKRRS